MAYISTTLTDAVVFGILILMLSVKPSGLMGKNRKGEGVMGSIKKKTGLYYIVNTVLVALLFVILLF